MKTRKKSLFCSLILLLIVVMGFNCVNATSNTVATTTTNNQEIAVLSLLENADKLIEDKKETELPVGKRVFIGYTPKEKFQKIKYSITPLPSQNNGVEIIPDVYFPPVEMNVKDEAGKYKELFIDLPDSVMKIKLTVTAVMTDGSIDKEYTFSLKQLELKAYFNMYNSSELIEPNSEITVEKDAKFEIRYSPKENFEKIICERSALPVGNGELLAQPKVYIPPVELPVKDATTGNYKDLTIELPDVDWSKWEFRLYAQLSDGSKTKVKTYVVNVGKVEPKLNLLNGNGNLIENKSELEFPVGKTLNIEYLPKEKFKSIKYEIISLATTGGNTIDAMPQTPFEPVEMDVKDAEGKFKDLSIDLPDSVMKIKLKMVATLVDNTKTEEKEYTFSMVKSELKSYFNIYNSSVLVEPNSEIKVEKDKDVKFELRYSPKENFEKFVCQIRALPVGNGEIFIQPKVYIAPVELPVKDATTGNYKDLTIELPDVDWSKWEIKLYAKLVDGSKTSEKVYIVTTGLGYELSLWENSKTLIKNDSEIEIEIGKKVQIRYLPNENFESVDYEFVQLPSEAEGSMDAMPQTPFKPVNVVVKDGDGKYKDIVIDLPNTPMKVKLKVKGTLVDKTKTEEKEYIFNLKEVVVDKDKGLEGTYSEWSELELKVALEKGLIPTKLKGKDYTNKITRAEFAAVAIELYEAVSGKSAQAEKNNPFTDTKDAYVLKAYKLGITNGVSETEFAPDKLITREQMATMMIRTLEALNIDTNIVIDEKIDLFDDHNDISPWAMKGVYFMSSKGVIKGVGNDRFSSKGDATREQAILVSLRNLNTFAKK